MEHGFIRVASAVPSVKVADVTYNVEQMKRQIAQAEDCDVEIVVFPELSLTGYSCQDLFTQQLLITEAEAGVKALSEFLGGKDVIAIVGVPVEAGNLLLNCAAVLYHGKVVAIVPKQYLPNYGEFYEKRWFASSQDFNGAVIAYAGTPQVEMTASPLIIETAGGVRFGVEICEDVWAPAPPSNRLALAGADLIFNLSASDELIGKHAYLKSLLSQQSARTICGYVYSGCGFGESTQDVVYGGNALIYENGNLLAESERFALEAQLLIGEIDVERLRSERRRNTTFVNAQRQVTGACIRLEPLRQAPGDGQDFLRYRPVDAYPFIPKTDDMQQACEEILSIQVMGLAKRLAHTHSSKVVIGISGGLDSTLALLVCVKTFDKLHLNREGIVGVTMPGFGTTDRTYTNALHLMEQLGITRREINITKSVLQHFEDIGHDAAVHDVAYENSQARERTQILMDLTNEIGGLVIGTGDLSELALGWATYNGDHMSMYGVNASVPKTLIKHLVRYVAKSLAVESEMTIGPAATLLDIIDTPISPELIPADKDGEIKQKTEDLVGPYDLHDFFLYYALRFGFRPRKIYALAQVAFKGQFDDATIKKWLRTFFRRFFAQQFKRSCLPDGPKVGSVSLSPRGDWRMPSDAMSSLWLDECETL